MPYCSEMAFTLMLQCLLFFRQNVCVDMPRDKAGEMNESEKLRANNDSDVSDCMDREHNSDVNHEQQQAKDCSCDALIEVTNNTALRADQQCNSRETESMDSNSTSINSQHSSSTAVKNQQCSTRVSAAVSISEAGVSHCHKSSDGSRRNSRTKCDSASVTAGVRVSKSSSSAVRQSPIELRPKPTYTLLPIGSLVVVVNGGTAQVSGDRTQLAAIAPRPTPIVSSSASLPTVSQEDSSAVARHDSLHDDVLLHSKQQKSIASVVTQTSSLPAHPRRKTASAATQTSERFAPASRLSKESRASQVVYNV